MDIPYPEEGITGVHSGSEELTPYWHPHPLSARAIPLDDSSHSRDSIKHCQAQATSYQSRAQCERDWLPSPHGEEQDSTHHPLSNEDRKDAIVLQNLRARFNEAPVLSSRQTYHKVPRIGRVVEDLASKYEDESIDIKRWMTHMSGLKAHIALFKRVILSNGGSSGISRMIEDFLDPETVELQGKILNSELFRYMLTKQRDRLADPFHGRGIYVNGVFDFRDHDYCRFYVGMSHLLHKRLEDHVMERNSESLDALHYYIMAIGGQRRTHNFLRLAHIPDGVLEVTKRRPESKDTATVILTLLEMACAIAFFSLPADVHNGFITPNIVERSIGSLHLNVMPPLLQGLSAPSLVRRFYVDHLKSSEDPEIAYWPQFRLTRIDKTRTRWAPHLTLDDYRQKFLQKINENGDSYHLDAFNADSEGLTPLIRLHDWIKKFVRGEKMSVFPPCGPPHARLALILSRCANDVSAIGLTEQNSIVWPLRLNSSPTALQGQDEHDFLVKSGIALLDVMGPAVVLLSGSEPAKHLLPQKLMSMRLLKTFSVSLSGQNFDLTIEIEPENNAIHRVYIVVPDLRHLYNRDEPILRRFANGLRLAAALTGIRGLKSRTLSNQSVMCKFFNLMRTEKDLKKKSRFDELPEVLKCWLADAGFPGEQGAKELVTCCETLNLSYTQCIHILMTIVPRAHYNVRNKKCRWNGKSRMKDEQTDNFSYPREAIDAIRTLWQQKNPNHVRLQPSWTVNGGPAKADNSYEDKMKECTGAITDAEETRKPLLEMDQDLGHIIGDEFDTESDDETAFEPLFSDDIPMTPDLHDTDCDLFSEVAGTSKTGRVKTDPTKLKPKQKKRRRPLFSGIAESTDDADPTQPKKVARAPPRPRRTPAQKTEPAPDRLLRWFQPTEAYPVTATGLIKFGGFYNNFIIRTYLQNRFSQPLPKVRIVLENLGSSQAHENQCVEDVAPGDTAYGFAIKLLPAHGASGHHDFEPFWLHHANKETVNNFVKHVQQHIDVADGQRPTKRRVLNFVRDRHGNKHPYAVLKTGIELNKFRCDGDTIMVNPIAGLELKLAALWSEGAGKALHLKVDIVGKGRVNPNSYFADRENVGSDSADLYRVAFIITGVPDEKIRIPFPTRFAKFDERKLDRVEAEETVRTILERLDGS